jgi:hypothetical protein
MKVRCVLSIPSLVDTVWLRQSFSTSFERALHRGTGVSHNGRSAKPLREEGHPPVQRLEPVGSKCLRPDDTQLHQRSKSHNIALWTPMSDIICMLAYVGHASSCNISEAAVRKIISGPSPATRINLASQAHTIAQCTLDDHPTEQI